MVDALRAEYRKTELYARHWGKPAKSAKSAKSKIASAASVPRPKKLAGKRR
jgi:hypothetical protein